MLHRQKSDISSFAPLTGNRWPTKAVGLRLTAGSAPLPPRPMSTPLSRRPEGSGSSDSSKLRRLRATEDAFCTSYSSYLITDQPDTGIHTCRRTNPVGLTAQKTPKPHLQHPIARPTSNLAVSRPMPRAGPGLTTETSPACRTATRTSAHPNPSHSGPGFETAHCMYV